MSVKLSKLNKLELRKVWGHEAIDFTNWLAEDENLSALSEEIGVEIKLIQTEATVGKFSVDILAKEETSDRKIIIENQLEDTNHDHLGKIITYASGYDAEIIIWIVKAVREEHKKAIEWLNEHTDENINFFLIKIELWQIEGSNPAPKFEMMVSPNEWAKAIKISSSGGEPSETKLKQLEFWKRFKEYVNQKDNKIRLRAPRPQHWYPISMGASGYGVNLTVNTKDNFVSCELWINEDKEFFEFLNERKDTIEEQIGKGGNWWMARKASGVRVRKEVDDVFDEAKLEENFEWLYQKTIVFQKVFSKYLKEFKR